MKHQIRISIILVPLVLSACHSSGLHARPSAVVDTSAEIRPLVDALMAADNAGDVDQAVSYFTEDAVMLPPIGAAMHGREAIRAHYGEAFGSLRLSISATVDEVRMADGWGMVRGEVHGTMLAKSSGKSDAIHDKYLAIVERGGDGRWRFARLSWGPVPAMS